MKEIFYEIFHFPLLEYFAAINKIFKDDSFYDKEFLIVLLKTLFDRKFNIWMILKILIVFASYLKFWYFTSTSYHHNHHHQLDSSNKGQEDDDEDDIQKLPLHRKRKIF